MHIMEKRIDYDFMSYMYYIEIIEPCSNVPILPTLYAE